MDDVLQLRDGLLNLGVRENVDANTVTYHGADECADHRQYPEGPKVDMSALKETLAVLLEEFGDIPGIIGSVGGLIYWADKKPGQYGG